MALGFVSNGPQYIPNIQDMLRGGWEFNPANYYNQTQELPPVQNGVNEILVNGSRSNEGPPLDVYEDFNLSNSDAVRERMAALQGGEEASAPERKGMFGIKGTLRDVLGTLGDAFLLQSGNKPIYAPQRERERLGDAMAGFTRDPLGAAERVGSLDPEMSQDLMLFDYKQGAAQAEAERQAAATAAKEQENSRKAYEEGATMFSQYAGAVAQNPAIASQVAPVMERIKQVYGLGDEFVVPGETADKALYSGYQYGGASPESQLSDVRGQQQLAISKQNADANTLRASRPPRAPAPRQPRAQTNLEYYQQIGNKPANQRTQAEKDFYNKFTSSGRSSSSSEPRRVRIPIR